MARYSTPNAPAVIQPVEAQLADGAAINTSGLSSSMALPLPANPVVLIKPLPPPVVTFVNPSSAPPSAAPVELPAITSSTAGQAAVPASLGERNISSLVKEVSFVSTISADSINQLQAGFYPGSNQILAQFAVDRFKLRFKSRNEVGHWVSVRAEIFVPRVDTPAEFPLFVYGAGTTGINNLCAPLDEDTRGRNWGQYQTHLASYAAQGFITVLPHWQGYDDQTRKHNYFIADLEASILLDATRAVYEAFSKNQFPNIQARPAQAVFYGGYSQGGHGAFAAVDAANQYAPDLPIKGIVGHATAPSVEALMRDRPPLAPYIIYAYLNYYGDTVIDPNDVFLPNWLPTFYTDASTKCVDEAYQYYPEDPALLYRPEFMEMLYNERLADAFPAFKYTLDINYVGDSANTNVPIILFQGLADTIVTPATHEHFVARLCNRAKNVNYKLYPDINHYQTRQFSFVDSINWMRGILNGHIPESQCSEFFTSKFE